MLSTASLAHAQSPAAGVAPEPAAAPATGAAVAAPATGAAVAAPATGVAAAAPAATGEASFAARLDAAEKRSAELEKRLATLEHAQVSPEDDDNRELLQLYGFIDVGVQRT
ncbi:hypothetical protein WMF28_04365 [Sorangium sp. So ce590]|uniref:hypothetical protein n=1 Tax=Sorangium sp. So ce590 TaxID=3133317 RepID=UPI003F604847